MKPSIKNLTSVTFICRDGLLIDNFSLGRQQTTISFRTNKVTQRFYSPDLQKKAVAEFTYSLSRAELDALRDLFVQLDCFTWEDDPSQPRSSAWEIRLRVGYEIPIRGFHQPPKAIEVITAFLNERITFKYPLMLCNSQFVSEADSVALLAILLPLMEQADQGADPAEVEQLTQQLLDQVFAHGLGDYVYETWGQDGINLTGDFLLALLLAEKNPQAWGKEEAFVFGTQFFAQDLNELKNIYLEDGVNIIGGTLMELKELELINEKQIKQLIDGVQDGYLYYLQLHDEEPKLRPKRPLTKTNNIIDLEQRRKKRT